MTHFIVILTIGQRTRFVLADFGTRFRAARYARLRRASAPMFERALGMMMLRRRMHGEIDT